MKLLEFDDLTLPPLPLMVALAPLLVTRTSRSRIEVYYVIESERKSSPCE